MWLQPVDHLGRHRSIDGVLGEWWPSVVLQFKVVGDHGSLGVCLHFVRAGLVVGWLSLVTELGGWVAHVVVELGKLAHGGVCWRKIH